MADPPEALPTPEPPKIQADGAFLGYLDFWIRFFWEPRRTLRDYAPTPTGDRISRHLAAFLVFSIALAAALYGVRLRLGWPQDEGRVADVVRAIGGEFLPVVVLIGLAAVAITVEALRVALTHAPRLIGKPKMLEGWEGPWATLNGLIGFAAIFIPTTTGLIMIVEGAFHALSPGSATAIAITVVLALMVLLFGYLPLSMTAVHHRVHGWRLGLSVATIMLLVVYWTTGEWEDAPMVVFMVALVALGGEIVIRSRKQDSAAAEAAHATGAEGHEDAR